MEQVTGLNLVQGNDDVLEEDNMFFSQWYSKSTDNTGQNIKQLWGAIELESLMNQRVEAVIDGLTYHFSSWHKLSIKSVQNVLQVLTLAGLLWIKELKEFLNEWGGNVHF